MILANGSYALAFGSTSAGTPSVFGAILIDNNAYTYILAPTASFPITLPTNEELRYIADEALQSISNVEELLDWVENNVASNPDTYETTCELSAWSPPGGNIEPAIPALEIPILDGTTYTTQGFAVNLPFDNGQQNTRYGMLNAGKISLNTGEALVWRPTTALGSTPTANDLADYMDNNYSNWSAYAEVETIL